MEYSDKFLNFEKKSSFLKKKVYVYFVFQEHFYINNKIIKVSVRFYLNIQEIFILKMPMNNGMHYKFLQIVSDEYITKRKICCYKEQKKSETFSSECA